MRNLLLSLLLLVFTGCTRQSSTVALNWYARLEPSPACGEGQSALLAGPDTLLCAVEQMIFSGDSLVVEARGNCYFVDLQAITDYKSREDLQPIDCAAFEHFIARATRRWPADRGEEKTRGH